MRLHLSLILAAASFAALSSAQADLAVGGSVDVPQITNGGPFGTRIASALDTAFTGRDVAGNAVFTGSLTSYVDRQADGRIAFTYMFTNTGSSTMDPIERFNVAGFTGFTTSVAQGLPAPDRVATSRGTRTPNNGNVVSFSYAVGSTYGPVMPGSQSQYLTVFTNATAYTTGSAQFINGGIANVATFVPSAVPEPASVAALGLGLVGLVRRRARKA